MNKPVVSLDAAKTQARATYLKVLERLKEHCTRQNELPFYHRAAGILNKTPVNWKKTSLGYSGKTQKKCRLFNGAITTEYEIIMNSCFLYSEDATKCIELTLIHEIAHVIAHLYDGTFAHNETFRTFDLILGGSGLNSYPHKLPESIPDSSISSICAPPRMR